MFEKLKKIFNKKKDQSLQNNYYDNSDRNDNLKNNVSNIEIDRSNIFKKNIKEREEIEGYDWFSDRYQTLIAQRNTTIFLLIFAIFSLSILGIVVIFLFKNKSIEPFIVEVDKKTGFVTFLKKDNKIISYSENEVIRNYFIKKYLDARETFDPRNYGYFYNKVVPAFSSPDVLKQFNNLIRSNEKSNPRIAYEDNLDCKVIINSMNEFDNNAIQVRFTVEYVTPDSRKMRITKVATINYDFVNYEMNEEMRYINPLGFIITGYRVSNENFN